MTPIDAKKIEELRGLLAKATPGPWVFLELTTKPDGLGYIQREDHDGKEIAHHGDMGRSRNENCTNAALIVAAVNVLPGLLDLAAQNLAFRTQAGEGVEEAAERWVDRSTTDRERDLQIMLDAEHARAEAAEAALTAEKRAKEEAEWERDRLRDVIERDRTKTAEIIGGIRAVVGRWSWLGEGRGSYAWDDDRYQDEFRQMLDALKEATDPLRALAADWSDCPQDYQGARIDWKAHSAALARALEDIAREAASPAASYEKNGPTWTGKDGHEYEDMSAHLEFAERIETLARSALQPTRTILEAPNAG